MKTKELGWVYILSNPSFEQDLIKIGMSQNDPALRSEELRTTGVPTPFRVEYKALVVDHAEVEKKVHVDLSRYRNTDDREFFRCTVPLAIQSIKKIADIRYQESEYAPPHTPSERELQLQVMIDKIDKEEADEVAKQEKREQQKQLALAIRDKIRKARERESAKYTEQDKRSSQAVWIGLILIPALMYLFHLVGFGKLTLLPLLLIPYCLFVSTREYKQQFSAEETHLINALQTYSLSDEELIRVAEGENPVSVIAKSRNYLE